MEQNKEFVRFRVPIMEGEVSCAAGSCATNGVTLANGFSNAIAQGLPNYVQTPDFRMYPKNIETPYTEIFNLSVQRQISADTAVTLPYVGSMGRHLTSNPKRTRFRSLLITPE
jgi:hypothetical protein